jgi:hypothetical protein
MVSYRQITSAGRVSRRKIAHGWLNNFRRGKIMMQGDVDRRTSEGLLSEQKSVVCTHVRKQSIETIPWIQTDPTSRSLANQWQRLDADAADDESRTTPEKVRSPFN